jgi:hypothetical protein
VRVDVFVTRWYHCGTRYIRRAFLLAEGKCNRKEWLENRIEELAEIFAMGRSRNPMIQRRAVSTNSTSLADPFWAKPPIALMPPGTPHHGMIMCEVRWRGSLSTPNLRQVAPGVGAERLRLVAAM